MLRFFINNELVNINLVEFSDGAIQYTIDPSLKAEFVEKAHIAVDPSTDVGKVLEHLNVFVDALMQHDIYVQIKSPTLYLPYLPYARADRRFSPTGSFGLEQFLTQLLHNFAFAVITVADPHSKVFLGYDVVQNAETKFDIMTVADCFRTVGVQKTYDAVVCPDKGAVERTQAVADLLGLPVVFCTKTRDPETGKLSNPQIESIPDGLDLRNSKLLIVDDIFDYGNTFLLLSSLLRSEGVSCLDLYVTHLIAPKGLDIILPVIDNVYYYNIVGKYIASKHVTDFNSRVRGY